MKKETLTIIVLIQVAMTALLVYDFFPQAFAPVAIPKIAILVILLALISTGIFYNRSKLDTSTQGWIWQLASTGYLFFLVVLLTLLGGKSTSGISLESPILWIVLAISFLEIHQQKKKLNSSMQD